MNKVILVGRLVRDPEVRNSNSGGAIAKYTLAVERKYKKDGEATADFINCVCFGKSADFTEKYLRKGVKMIVTGRIQTGNYTNKEGQKVYTTDVLVEEQEFSETKNAQTIEEPRKSTHATDDMGFMQIPDGIDEELPF